MAFLLVIALGTVGLIHLTASGPAQDKPPADATLDDEMDDPTDDGTYDDGTDDEESPSPSPTPSASASAKPSQSATSTRPGSGRVLWAADTGMASRAFEGVETAPGSITVASDPKGRYGSSFRFETWQNADGTKARCESRGMRGPDGKVLLLGSSQLGQTFYVGWRALWGPLPTQSGAWMSLFQMHVSGVGTGGLNVGPFVLRTLGDGKLHFQLISPDGSSRHIWTGPLAVNAWNSFVIGFKLSKGGDGWVEFWYNGAQQRFTNNTTRYPGATLWGTHVNVKWGIYRSGANHTANAVAYLNHAQLGTTYTAVAV